MATLSKEEYLKRYLNPAESGDYKKKKKKRKEKVKKIRGMKIVDDDVSWSNIAPKEEEADLPDALLPMEEKPQIEVVDNRTEEEKALDAYRKSDKWKMVKKQNDVKGEPDSDNDLDDVPRRQKTRHDSSSDMDIPRRPRKNDGSESDNNEDRRRKNKRYDTDSDMDLPRRATKRHDSDSDIEVPRKSRKENKNNVKAKRHDSDSDLEVNRTRPSHQRHSSPSARNKEGKNSKRHHKSRHDSDSDLDLPRSKGQKEKSMKSRHDSSSDSDLDVPRSKSTSKLKGHSRNDSTQKSRHDSDSDMEVPRRKEHNESMKSEKKKQMSSGGAGGLTSRHELKKELEERKKRESDIDRLAKDSKKSATVFREKGGKKRDLEKERFEKEAEDKEKQKKKDKYEKWGKGVTQSSMKDYALEDLIHESNKPLARYRDDADLDALQRSRIRDGDPMAEYLSKKKSKESGNRPSKKRYGCISILCILLQQLLLLSLAMPKYRGPLPPPNRYHIQPGYRWDGVDRSNGFEKKFFTKQSERTAQKDEAYKWSVEDM